MAILKLSRNGYSSLYVVLLAKLLLPKLLLVKGSVCPIARVSRVGRLPLSQRFRNS